MKLWRVLVLVGLLTMAFTARVLAIEVPMELVQHSTEVKTYQPYGYQSLNPLDAPPLGRWQLPKLNSDSPVYALASLGDEKRLLIFDKQDPKHAHPGRVYFDANGNGDLTDDPILDLDGNPQKQIGGYFAIANAQVRHGSVIVPFSFRVYLRALQFTNLGAGKMKVSFSYLLRSHCHYAGEFEVGGHRYRIHLGDYNANGKFDDQVQFPRAGNGPPSPYAKGDRCFLATGRDIGYRDFNHYSPMLFLGGKLYDVEFDIERSRLMIEPSKAETVPVTLGMGVEHMTLCSEDSEQGIMMYRPGNAAHLPAGRYRFTHYQALRRDPQGDLWTLSASCTFRTPFTDFTEDGATLPLGEPYLAKTDVPAFSRSRFANNGGSVSIQFSLAGSGGEEVGDLTHLSGNATETPLAKNGKRPKEPTYRVLEPSGKVVASGSFEYG